MELTVVSVVVSAQSPPSPGAHTFVWSPPTLAQSRPVWPAEYCWSDSVWLPRVRNQSARHGSETSSKQSPLCPSWLWIFQLRSQTSCSRDRSPLLFPVLNSWQRNYKIINDPRCQPLSHRMICYAWSDWSSHWNYQLFSQYLRWNPLSSFLI